MSGTESESPLVAGRDALGPGSWLFAICIAVLVAGGMALIMLFSSRAADSFVLAALAVLAMVGTFFLFGLAAGHIRIGEASEPSALPHDAIEQLGHGIEIAARDGSPVYANAAFREIVGVDANGKPRALEEAFASEPVAAECLFRLMRAAERGEAHEEEFRVRGADHRGRSTRWIRLGVRSLQKPGTAGDGATLWHIADITNDRAREAEAVRDLEASLAYYDTMPVGLVAAGAGGAVTHLNATLSGWIGLDPGAIRSRAITLADIFADTGEALLRTAVAQAAGQTIKLELDIVRVDGVRIPVEIVSQPTRTGQGSGELTALVLNRATASTDNGSAVADVSFARFFHSAPFGIATLDSEGRILSANGAFARMFLEERKAGAKGIVDIFARSADETAREAIGHALQQVVDGRASVEPIEVSSGGEPSVTRRIYMSPIAQARRQGEVAVAYVIDATEQKSLELKFAQSQKMEAVGKLAGGIAHDFNNVLTAIIGFSDLLLQTHRPTDPAYKDIMNIKQNANRAAGLVRQLLAFSRQQTLQPEMLDLGEVLTDFSALLNRALGEKVELKILNGRDLWNVKADRTQFDQVILNLAVNAGDAMPNGGRLTIRTRNVGERDSVKLASLGIEQGEYVLIEVEDTGVGMPQEVMSKIFEPFYTTKDVGKGTGLGLSTVYGIIKQTGGYVFPESEVGVGTTFRIYLPRHIPDAEEVAEAKRAQKKELPRDLTGAGRVLLVEDEDSVRNFAGRALKRQGYEVFEASTGLEALEVVEREGDRFDIVVSDVVMPEMDGPTLLSELRGRNPNLKVIFISGYPDEVFKKSLDPNQQFAFLSKPFTLPQLAAKVKEELAR